MSEKYHPFPGETENNEREGQTGRFDQLKNDLRVLKHANSVTKEEERTLIDLPKNAWGIYDEDKENFENTFEPILREGGFEEYLTTHYKNRLGDLTGMEIGGPGRKFFGGFSRDIFKQTVGISLNDLRKPEEKALDTQNNHDVLVADVFSRKTNSYLHPSEEGFSWTEVETWVKKHGKPDFIIERMVGGTDGLQRNDIFLAILRRWYSILNHEGTMFIQTPPRNFHSIINDENFLEQLANKNRGVVEFRFDKMGGTSGYLRPIFMIRKLAHAPEDLYDLLKK